MPDERPPMPVAPVLPPVVKGRCGVPRCSDKAHLYVCGWRCDRHSPEALRRAPAEPAGPPEETAVEKAAGPPAGWPVPNAPTRRYSETQQRHTWTKVKEHHKVCGFCLIWVVNNTVNHYDWWQTWTWPDGKTGTNQGERYQKVPKCPGPTEVT